LFALVLALATAATNKLQHPTRWLIYCLFVFVSASLPALANKALAQNMEILTRNVLLSGRISMPLPIGSHMA
jgi:hypothetical protein